MDEQKTLGQQLGIINDTFDVTNDFNETVTNISVKYDFRASSDDDIKSWLCGNRRIPLQRVMRKLHKSELIELKNMTFLADDVGHKIQSRTEQIDMFYKAFLAANVPDKRAMELAIAAIDNPDALSVVNK